MNLTRRRLFKTAGLAGLLAALKLPLPKQRHKGRRVKGQGGTLWIDDVPITGDICKPAEIGDYEGDITYSLYGEGLLLPVKQAQQLIELAKAKGSAAKA